MQSVHSRENDKEKPDIIYTQLLLRCWKCGCKSKSIFPR